MSETIALTGIDGSNPLAFLAALGALRLLTLHPATRDTTMRWEAQEGIWRPVLDDLPAGVTASDVVEALAAETSAPRQATLLSEIGPDLTISGRRLRHLAAAAVDACRQADGVEIEMARVAADFVAAFGCDAITNDEDPDGPIRDTALRTMSGAGHQHFIAFMTAIIAATDASHLNSTLFSAWTYSDAGQGLNLRWDPADDRRYALRWKDPSGDPSMTMRGANRLAIEALPLFVTAPMSGDLQTAGFVQRRREGVRWTWPIWTGAVDLETCRTLLQSSELVPPSQAAPPEVFAAWRSKLARRGVEAVYQSQRITIGKFRNFTPSRSL